MQGVKILVVDDEQLIRWSFHQKLTKNGFSVFVAASAEEGLEVFKQETPDIVFLDNKLPHESGLQLLPKLKKIKDDAYIIFMTAFGNVDTAVQAIKMGAYDFVNKPFTFDEIEVLIGNIMSKLKLEREVNLLRMQNTAQLGFNSIIGKSKAVRDLIELSRQISTSKASTVLLLGETGTGKDLLARAIHNERNRSDAPFVTINCSSLPETLLESELFGHEKGAFTDAHKQKKGLFEVADGGTVFLDEIGEISMGVQVKLLNILENRSFRRLGGTKDISVNIRIIAATNKNLVDSIKQNLFRYDLYYRLKVFQIVLPPLRDRKEDIALLAEHFLKLFNAQFNKRIQGIAPPVMETLIQYDWPGNVRELRNVIERAVILENGTEINRPILPGEVESPDEPEPAGPHQTRYFITIPEEGLSLYDVERDIIIQALQRTGFNKSKAARLIGISRDTLRYKMQKYDL